MFQELLGKNNEVVRQKGYKVIGFTHSKTDSEINLNHQMNGLDGNVEKNLHSKSI